MVFLFQAEDGIRDTSVTGVQTCALPILHIRGGKGRKDRLCAMAHKRSDVPRKVMCRESRSISRRHWLLRSALVSRCVRSEERRVGKGVKGGWAREAHNADVEAAHTGYAR